MAFTLHRVVQPADVPQTILLLSTWPTGVKTGGCLRAKTQSLGPTATAHRLLKIGAPACRRGPVSRDLYITRSKASRMWVAGRSTFGRARGVALNQPRRKENSAAAERIGRCIAVGRCTGGSRQSFSGRQNLRERGTTSPRRKAGACKALGRRRAPTTKGVAERVFREDGSGSGTAATSGPAFCEGAGCSRGRWRARVSRDSCFSLWRRLLPRDVDRWPGRGLPGATRQLPRAETNRG
ncbi:hypothetical protein MRX96_029295 [Rhipicephalus microplus]